MSDQVPRQPQQPQAPLGPNPRCTRCGEPQENEPEFGGYICWPCHFAGLEDPNHPCPRFGHPQVLDQDTGEYSCRRCRDAWAEEPQAPPCGQIPHCPRCQQPQRFYDGLGVYACAECAFERDGEELPAIPVCQAPGCEGTRYPLELDQFGQLHCFWCDLRAREAAQQVPNPPANDQVVEEWPQFVPLPRNPPQAEAPGPNQAPLNRQGQRPAGNAPRQVNQNPIQDHREQVPDDPSSDEFVPWIPPTPESRRKTWIKLFGDPYLDSDPDAPMESPPRMPAPMEHQAPPGPNQVLLNRQGQREDEIAPRQVNQNPIQHPQVQDSEDSMSENDWGYFGDDEEEYPGAPIQSRPRRHVPMERRQAPHRPNQVLLNRQGPRQVGNVPPQPYPTQFPQVRNPGAAVQSRPQMPPPRNPPQATAHRQTSPERNQVLLNRQGQWPNENSPQQAYHNPTQFPQVRNPATAMQVRPQMPAPSDRNSPNRAPLENSSPIPRAQNPMGQEYSAQPMIMDPRLYRTHPCLRCGVLQDYDEVAREYQCRYGHAQERPPVAQGQAPGAPYLDENMDPDDQSSQDSPGNSPDSRRGRY